MTTVRNMFWALALLSLSLAAAPAVTKPVAVKGKAPTKAATKTTAKAPAGRVPLKAGTPAARPATAYRAPATAARGRVQPQYSRYGNTRRPVPTGRAAVARQRPVYHPVPMVPSADRTKEIQSALAQKGYLNGEPSGTWDTDSTAAMKRFQKEQNLEADGKFNSLSLIALGLGPKRTLTASSANPPAIGSIPVPPKP